jgi:hypothetical protein
MTISFFIVAISQCRLMAISLIKALCRQSMWSKKQAVQGKRTLRSGAYDDM